ncbi:MAG: ABC transporter permease, partial [Candidatus Aminicenantales bacterium]
MNYEFFIARRYLTAKRKQAFISVITLISILGITIGVMALIIAIALITGFQSDVQDKILGSTAHIMVSDVLGEGLAEYARLAEKIRKKEEVIEVSPVVYDTVLVSGPLGNSGAVLRGIDMESEKTSARWLRNLETGQLPQPGARPEGILLGRDLALKLGTGVGDIVHALTPSFRLSPTGLIPRQKRFRVTGIFHTGLYEFDSATALAWLGDAQRLFRLEGRVSMLQVR